MIDPGEDCITPILDPADPGVSTCPDSNIYTGILKGAQICVKPTRSGHHLATEKGHQASACICGAAEAKRRDAGVAGFVDDDDFHAGSACDTRSGRRSSVRSYENTFNTFTYSLIRNRDQCPV